MSRNNNFDRREPIMKGIKRIGLTAEVTAEGYILVNIPVKKKYSTSTIGENNKLIAIQDLLDSLQGVSLPPPSEGGIIIGDGTEYIIIPPGNEDQVLTIISGIPTWVDNDGLEEAPNDGLQYGRQSEDWTEITGQAIYDGVDTEAIILAKNPTTSLGEVWWSSDTKKDFRAITSASLGSDIWQHYSPPTLIPEEDTWVMPTTPDGHSLNLGQEEFIPGINADVSGSTELDPKVYAVAGVNSGNEKLMDFIKVDASDIKEGIDFGINTVVSVSGELTKVTTRGLASGINTSSWSVNDVLYIDPIIKGDMTNIKPPTDAWVVGIVLKSNLLTGIIRILASSAINDSPAVIPAGFSVSWLTGDPSATAPYYQALGNDKGTVATVTQTVLVNDNQKLPIPLDFLTVEQIVEETLNIAQLTGQVEWSVSAAQAVKKVHIEIYHADSAGVPIDVPNSLPVGDLGVRPYVALESSLVDPSSNTVVTTVVDGLAPTAITLAIGERLRYHVLFEKIGAQGGSQTFTLYHGNLQKSFIAVPVLFALDDLLDVSITTPVEAQVLTYDATSGNWQNKISTAAGGFPGGLTGAVQFNDAGVFDGEETQLFWDKANNRLGIGTATPAATLHTVGNVRFDQKADTLDDGLRVVNLALTGSAILWADVNNNTKLESVGGSIILRAEGVESLFVEPTGNVGIGTSTPAQKLEVSGNNAAIRVGGTGGVEGARIELLRSSDGAIGGSITTEGFDVAIRNGSGGGRINLIALETINMTLPTSATGLIAGDIWNNAGVLNIV